MKKKLLIIITTCFLLSGCSQKTLTCTLKKETKTGNSEEKKIYTFKNNKINTITTAITVNFKDEYKYYINTMEKDLKKSFKDYNNYQGIKFNISKDKSTITASVKVDNNKMNKESKKIINFNEKQTYKKIKEKLKKENYKCR